MIEEKDKVYSEAANSIYVQNSDETIRAMCEARQEAIFHEQYVQKQLKELKEAREEAISQKKQLAEKDAKLSAQQNLIEQLQAEIERLKEKLK